MTRRPSCLTASIARFSNARIEYPEERARRLFYWLFLIALLVIGIALGFVLHKEAEAGRELERVRSLEQSSRVPSSPASELRFEF